MSDLFGINCATGMSALMRKELLDNRGGFDAYGCYLAEDYFFAKSIQVTLPSLQAMLPPFNLPCHRLPIYLTAFTVVLSAEKEEGVLTMKSSNLYLISR